MREAGEFVLTLMHASTNAHILHLRTRSRSDHEALNEFYKELPEKVDKLAEAIQGAEQKLLDFPMDYYSPADTPLEELVQLKEYVDEERKEISQRSEIQNLVDEIAELIDSTIYKLAFLS